jgi:hypothetical protein
MDINDFVGLGSGEAGRDIDADSGGEDAADAEYVFMKEYREKRIQGKRILAIIIY